MIGRIANRAFLLVLIGMGAGIAHLWINAESDRPVQVGWKPRAASPVVPTPGVVVRPADPPTELPPEGGSETAAAMGTEPEASAAPEPATPAAALPEGFITLEQAKALFDRADGTVYFVDARTRDEFNAGHITGAMHVMPESLVGTVPSKILDYLPGATVVVYCGGGLCDASKNVAKYLDQLKLPKETYVFEAGFPAWQSAYPDAVETGPDMYGGG